MVAKSSKKASVEIVHFIKIGKGKNNMKILYLLFTTLVCCMLLGCNPVTMKNPFPESGYVNLNQLDGSVTCHTYTFQDSTFTIKPYIIDITPTEVKIGWNVNTEPDLMNYRVYADGVLKGSTEETVFTFTELPDPSLITVTALDSSGNESDHSEPAYFNKDKAQ